MDQRMTNEQKLEEVYQILTAQEARRKGMLWMKVAKWLIIFSLIYLIYSNPQAIMGRVTEVIKPLILSTASGMIATQKEELSKSLKDMLPAGVELK